MPHFQNNHHMSTMSAAAKAEKLRPELAEVHSKAVDEMVQKYADEKAARG